jgi:5'-deoxynucleotidase YfbR-like HD superfamily hydrolase
MNYVRTFTGMDMHYQRPSLNHIVIEDIACHLSRINRYLGASQLPITVAAHSVNVAIQLAVLKQEPAVQLLGLLHDGHEYMTGDVPSPLKREIAARAKKDIIGQIAAEIDRVIFERFGLAHIATPKNLAFVNAADRQVFAAEWRDWMKGPCPDAIEPAKFAIKPCGPDKAEDLFLETFRRLQMLAGLSTQYRNVPSGIFK